MTSSWSLFFNYYNDARSNKQNVHYHIHNSPPFCFNPVHASSYSLILYYYLLLGLPCGLFPSRVHIKNLRELQSSIRAICPAYLITFYLLNQLAFPEEYTHTFPQLYLQMKRVMLHTVTNTHQMAILNRTFVLLLYISKHNRNIREIVKKFYFITQDYKAADFCITRKKYLLYCCCCTAAVGTAAVVLLLLVLLILLYHHHQNNNNYNNNKNNKYYYYYCYCYYW